MSTIRHFSAAAAALILLTAASGCHRKPSAGDGEIPHEVCPEPVETPSTSDPVTAVQTGIEFPESFGAWTSLEVPVQVSVTSPKSLSIGGRASMVQGRELLISLRFIGFEVAQLYADCDSVFAVDKMHKWYVAESIDRLGARTGLTLADLQGYLLGRPVRPVPRLGDIETIYDWNPETQRLGAVGFARHSEPVAGIAYGPAETGPTGPTASSVDIAAILGKNEIGGTINYRLSQAKWNSISEGLSFKRPGTAYRRLEISQIAQNL